MKYATISNNSILQFPITKKQFDDANPRIRVNFNAASDEILLHYNIVRVYEGSRPESDDRTQIVTLEPYPVFNGIRWEQQWTVTIKTVEQIAAYDDTLRSRIKHEASERITSITPEWKQRNSLARSLELLRKGEANLTEREAIEVREIEKVWAEIQRIRDMSNALEALDPPPEDFADDRHWV